MTQQEKTTAVAKTEMVPVDAREPHWTLSILKKSFGTIKKYGSYLVPGYYQARVRQEEAKARKIDAEAKAILLEAHGNYAKTMAEVEKMLSDGVDVVPSSRDVQRIIEASLSSPADTWQDVLSATQAIEAKGGDVDHEYQYDDVIDAQLGFLEEPPKEKNTDLPGIEPEQSISVLGLSNRVVICLTKNGINTVGGLVNKTSLELMEIRSFGVVSLIEVTCKLSQAGLSLRVR